MKVDIYNIKAEKTGQVSLVSSVFGQKVNQSLISQAVRVYLSNQRKASAVAKDRSQVAGTTKKVWSQKGTGRARHGDNRAPIFVGGGSAHGPQGDQNYKLKMSKKMTQKALTSTYSQFAQAKSIIVVEDIAKIKPKTKVAYTFLTKLLGLQKIDQLKRIGLIYTSQDSAAKTAFANIPFINLINISSINTYQLLQNNYLIISQNSLAIINK